jgi:hypothetical protein
MPEWGAERPLGRCHTMRFCRCGYEGCDLTGWPLQVTLFPPKRVAGQELGSLPWVVNVVSCPVGGVMLSKLKIVCALEAEGYCESQYIVDIGFISLIKNGKQVSSKILLSWENYNKLGGKQLINWPRALNCLCLRLLPVVRSSRQAAASCGSVRCVRQHRTCVTTLI